MAERFELIRDNTYRDTETGGLVFTRTGQSPLEVVEEAAAALEQPPTAADVVAERERRLSLGFDYDFGNGRGVHRIGTTPADMKGWDEVTAASQAAIHLGYPESTVEIVTDTAPVTITMMEWQQILAAAAQFRQPIWAASFALQSMPVIPSDFNSDEWW